MINNIKKIFLSTIIGSATIIPLAFAASYSINKFESSDINYLMSPQSNPEILVNNFSNQDLKSPENLSKIFYGINESNLENLEVELVNSNSDSYLINLMAKDGYLINGQNSLISNELKIIIDYELEPLENENVELLKTKLIKHSVKMF
ncbi:MAG: hypothetical protein ACRCXE_01470 [Metamycoplasmataceae bacterium]